MSQLQEPGPGRQTVFPAAAGWPSEAGPTPQQPVLVLDMDPAALDAEPGTLGFGRLQVQSAPMTPRMSQGQVEPCTRAIMVMWRGHHVTVNDPCQSSASQKSWLCCGFWQVKEASEVPGTVPMAQGSGEFSGSAARPMTRQDPVLGDVVERAAPSKPEPNAAAQPIIGEVVDRPVGDVTERPVQSATGAAAAAAPAAPRESAVTGPAPGGGRRPSRFAAQRGGGGSGSAADCVAGQPSGSADGDAGVLPAGKEASTAAATSAATRAERLQAEMAEVNARLEAEIAELSASEDEEQAAVSDAESDDSKQSTFDSLNMASTLDMGALLMTVLHNDSHCSARRTKHCPTQSPRGSKLEKCPPDEPVNRFPQHASSRRSHPTVLCRSQ